MSAQKSYIDRNGKLAIPIKIREKLKLKPGDEVSLDYNGSELVVSNVRLNLEKARQILNKYKDKDLLKELKLLRQEDAAKE